MKRSIRTAILLIYVQQNLWQFLDEKRSVIGREALFVKSAINFEQSAFEKSIVEETHSTLSSELAVVYYLGGIIGSVLAVIDLWQVSMERHL